MSDPDKYSGLFVVIPAFNESNAIRAVLQDVLSHGYTAVVVDDGSSEDMVSPVKDLPAWYLQHPVNLGQGAALQTGIEFAVEKGAELIVTFDADGQHQAKDIAALAETIRKEGIDIVLGSRFMKGAGHNMSSKRKTLLQLARYINYFFTGLLLTDAHNGLRVMTAAAAGKLVITENGMSHATEILSNIRKKKLKYKEAPVTVVYTDYSRQKGQTLWSGFRIFFDILLSKIFK